MTVTATGASNGGGLINGLLHTGSIDGPGEVDTWTFTATAGDRIAVHIGEIVDQTTSGRGSGSRLRTVPVWAPVPDGRGPIGDLVAPATGTYTVLVASFDSGFDGTGTYRLTMTHSPGPSVGPGDQGGPLTNGGIHTGEILQGDLDVWTFTATVGERIALHIGEITDNRRLPPLDSSLGSQRRHTRLCVRADAAEIGDVIAPVTGTYLVLVASFDSGFDGTGTYRLNMAKTPGPITVSDGDQGGPLTNGGIHTGEILQGDLDVWTFTATAGQRIAVHIGEITDTDDFRPWIRVWAPNGATLGSASGLDAAEIVTSSRPVTGTYLVLVASFDSGFDGTGTYRLNMAKTPGPITVSDGDQGGPLTNGGIHTGEILQGESMCGPSRLLLANALPCTSVKLPTPTISVRGFVSGLPMAPRSAPRPGWTRPDR